MEAIFYITIFIIGTLFGSFYTLAVYRIPKRQDILYTHSYCPNCNHKLNLIDLFPIISYLSLGGKCRYCKEKIRPRYLILEVLSGIFFVIISLAMGLSIYELNLKTIINIVFMVLYITFIILIAGIDKESRKIDKLVNIYGVVISCIYMIYLCIVEKANIYRYGIYLILYVIMITLNNIKFEKYKISKYIIGILLSLITMLIFTGSYVMIATIILMLFTTAFYILIKKVKKNKTYKQIIGEMKIGYYLAFQNIIIYTIVLFYKQYIL